VQNRSNVQTGFLTQFDKMLILLGKKRMVPRGGVEPPTLRFSGPFSINSIKHLAKQQTENPSKKQCNWKTAARAQCCPSPPNRLASPTIDQNLHGADAVWSKN
jgi:hypothetical protein